MIHRAHITPGLLLLALLWGCSTEDGLPGPRVEADQDTLVEERLGTLLAEFVYPRSWGGGEGVEVQAQFLDARGVPVESALEALEVWMPRRGLEQNDCVFLESESKARGGDVSLQLLDVGRIAVESPDEVLSLPPRRLPDLLSAFYGVVYGSEWSWERDANVVEYYPGAPYRFSAPGSPLAGGFDVVLHAPEPIVLVAANGEELRGVTNLTVDAFDDLELIWDVDQSAPARAEVYLDLFTGYGPGQLRLQCRVDDDGAFSIPGSLLADLQSSGRSVELELRRVRRTDTTIDGLDEAQFYFVTTDRVGLAFQ